MGENVCMRAEEVGVRALQALGHAAAEKKRRWGQAKPNLEETTQ